MAVLRAHSGRYACPHGQACLPLRPRWACCWLHVVASRTPCTGSRCDQDMLAVGCILDSAGHHGQVRQGLHALSPPRANLTSCSDQGTLVFGVCSSWLLLACRSSSWSPGHDHVNAQPPSSAHAFIPPRSDPSHHTWTDGHIYMSAERRSARKGGLEHQQVQGHDHDRHEASVFPISSPDTPNQTGRLAHTQFAVSLHKHAGPVDWWALLQLQQACASGPKAHMTGCSGADGAGKRKRGDANLEKAVSTQLQQLRQCCNHPQTTSYWTRLAAELQIDHVSPTTPAKQLVRPGGSRCKLSVRPSRLPCSSRSIPVLARSLNCGHLLGTMSASM